MMARRARSLDTLVAQCDSGWTDRSLASDGWVGDADHARTSSDHNPDPWGVVHAQDLTHDPSHAFDCRDVTAALVASRDPRISYIIWNRKIVSSTTAPWTWRPYTGANPHSTHMHLSVNASNADDPSPWEIPMTPAQEARLIEVEKKADRILWLLEAKRDNPNPLGPRIDAIYTNTKK